MRTEPFDWMLHAPMVFRILTSLKYLKNRGIVFKMKGSTIHKHGGWPYSPSEIDSFDKALIVLRDEACACTPHFSAICLLQGASYYKILDSGRDLLRKMFHEHCSDDER